MVGIFVGTAQAVHDTGLFQLDGDAQTSLNSSPSASEDWDMICKANLFNATTAPTGCHVNPTYTFPAGNTVSTASTFVTDAFNAGSDNIFKGGTDDEDISGWQWKQATPSPNKADLENAFAAQYTCTAAMVTAGACSSTYSGHKLMFFGGDRYSNNGDTNIGIWFFHNSVTTSGKKTATDGSCPVSSGCGFTGLHTAGNISLGGSTGAGCNPNPNPGTNICTPGDLFVLSAFTGGGSEPTIKIFEWVGSGNATKNYLGSNNCFTNSCTLQPLAIPTTPGFTDNRCDGATVSADPACAIVNPAATGSPWLFQDQASGSPANVFGANELYEGGIDLSALGFGNACTSSVLLNTRSSQSGTSVLQDFALGQLGSCTSSLHTTPSAGSGGSVSIGAGTVSVTDSATITVNGVSSWTGTLDTYLCGPITSGACTTSGVHVTHLTGVTDQTTQPIVSDSATLTSVGRYCWLGVFTSGTSGVPDATDSSSNECFNVTAVSPSLDTQATDSAGNPVTSAVTFGNAVYDTATLAGAATEPGTDGGNATYPSINATNEAYAGTISFKLLGPDDCATTATGTGTNPQSVNVTGNTTYGPVGFTPNHPGTYHWVATYTDTGSVNNVPNTVTHNGGCNDTDEDVTVNTIPTQITTAPFAYPNDSATITSSASGDNLPAGGTVRFRLFKATTGVTALANCLADDGTANSTGLLYNQQFSTNTTPAHSEDFSTTNTTVSVNTSGTYYWRVTYAPGDTAHTGIQSRCVENTAFTFVGDSGTGTAFP